MGSSFQDCQLVRPRWRRSRQFSASTSSWARSSATLSCHQKGESCCCSGLLACCRCCCYYCLAVADHCLAVADHCLAVVLGVQVCLLCVPCVLGYLYRADTCREANLDLRTTPANIAYYREVQSCQVILPAVYSAKRTHAFKPKLNYMFSIKLDSAMTGRKEEHGGSGEGPALLYSACVLPLLLLLCCCTMCLMHWCGACVCFLCDKTAPHMCRV